MPKPSSRFRSRKINFKSAINIYVGSLENPFDGDELQALQESLAGASGSAGLSHSSGNVNLPPGFAKNENGETVRVETGVDKEEEGEHHLQAVISASAAALQSSTNGAAGSGSTKPAIAHIPTPDATGVVADFQRYYKPGAYVDPHTYIRTSDTVEETMGIAYTMDEDDEDWLDDFNKSVKENNPTHFAQLNGHSPLPNGSASDSTASTSAFKQQVQPLVAKGGHYPTINTSIGSLKLSKSSSSTPPLSPSGLKKEKGKEVVSPQLKNLVSEDDFELVMDLFERITDRKVPTLHLDISRIPALEDLEPAFSNYLPVSALKVVKHLARVIYPHWKDRRLQAGGKAIVAQLDYDESNESPYVCFRRREVKVARKTRRTDTQTLERLVRLKSDLSSAQELLIKVLDRERCKRESLATEQKIFENRIRMRDLKRKLGEDQGDEGLLIARREKKRKREDLQQPPLGGTKIVIPTRNLTPLTPGLPPDALPLYKDRTANVVARIDKDMQRKREQEIGWEDLTDTAFLPLPQPSSTRFWRTPERLSLVTTDGRKNSDVVIFDHQVLPFVQHLGTRYRKRVGRGGRVLLDRLARRKPSSPDEEEDADGRARKQERWKYDSDLATEYPITRHPLIVDDFEARYAAARLSLVSSSDWEALAPNTLHIEEATRWAGKDTERPPPVQVVGKLPGLRPNPFNGMGGMNGQGINGTSAIGPGGGGGGGLASNPATASMASQMMAAASRAHTVAQAQAQSNLAAQMRRASSNTPQQTPQPQPHPQLPPNASSYPRPPAIQRIMYENAAA